MNSLQQQLSSGSNHSSTGSSHSGSLRQQFSKRMDGGGLPTIKNDMLRSPVKLRIEEKVLDSTGDSFYITDAKKKRVYEIEGSKTVDQHKILRDMEGHLLLQMRHPEQEYIISDPDGKVLLMLVQAEGGKDVHAFVRTNNNTTTTQLLDISGNAGASIFQVKNSAGTVIAGISRASKSIKRIFTGQDSYVADIFAGSPALMAFIVVALDEIFAD